MATKFEIVTFPSPDRDQDEPGVIYDNGPVGEVLGSFEAEHPAAAREAGRQMLRDLNVPATDYTPVLGMVFAMLVAGRPGYVACRVVR